ncbi:MAG: hypothetical protein H7210_08905 [Pyrinomonadaceae bacterium]|nr:hypothetical protein [Phycisphaerales bacterium]
MHMRSTAFFLCTILLSSSHGHAQCSPGRLTNPAPAYHQRMGESVAIAGNNAAVGSPWGDVNGSVQAGFVRMYAQGTFGWAYHSTLSAHDQAEGDHFGAAIDISGEYFIAGAPNRELGDAIGAGAAYLYRRQGASWWFVQRMDALNPQDWANLGDAVALSGEIAVLGVPGHPTNGSDRGGLAEVWEKTVNSTFARTTRLYRETAYNNDEFGAAVDVFDGVFLVPDLIAIGAPRRHSVVAENAGVVFLYSRSPEGWVQSDLLYGSDVTSYQKFGAAVSCLGNRVAVGAPAHSINGVHAVGAVYVFERNAANTGWVEVVKLTAPTPTQSGIFGRSVDLTTNDRLVVGCLYPQRTYVYRRSAAGAWQLEHELAGPEGTQLGTDVAMSGNDLFVGEPAYDNAGVERAGAALVFNLNPDGGSDMAAFAPVIGPGTYFGCTSIATNDGSTSCTGSNASRDVWYRFDAPCSGQFTIDTIGSDFDTILSIHIGSSGTAANTIECNDNRSIGLTTSRVTMNMLSLGTYLIRVSGSGPAAGAYTLNISSCEPICSCDWNADQVVNSQDFFDFITDFFANNADINADGTTNSQDFFDFLTCFFKGC